MIIKLNPNHNRKETKKLRKVGKVREVGKIIRSHEIFLISNIWAL